METVLLYIALNVLLFGSLWGLAKTVEVAVWYLIVNYNEITENLNDIQN